VLGLVKSDFFFKNGINIFLARIERFNESRKCGDESWVLIELNREQADAVFRVLWFNHERCERHRPKGADDLFEQVLDQCMVQAQLSLYLSERRSEFYPDLYSLATILNQIRVYFHFTLFDEPDHR